MPARKKSNPALTRQRNAARKARLEKRWETAIANYTRALAHKGLSLDLQIELLEGRVVCFRQMGETKKEAADLEKLTVLQQAKLDERGQFLKQREAELEILSSIAEALVDQADYERIGQIVGQKVVEFFDAEMGRIAFYDEASGMIQVPYYYERGEVKEVEAFEYWEGVSTHVLKTRKPIYIATAEESEKYGVIYSDEFPAESGLMAPILSGKKTLGLISIQHSQKHTYSEHQLDILTAIANSMAVALENARLFDETKQRNAELAVINSVQEALAKELDLQDIYRTVGQKVREIFKVQTVVLTTMDPKNEIVNYDYILENDEEIDAFSRPMEEWDRFLLGLDGPLVVNEKAEEFRGKYPREFTFGEQPKAFVKVVYRVKGGQSGVLSIQDTYREHAFSDTDVRLLETIANSLAVALENARLFDETKQRSAELAVINSVQEALAKELDLQDIYRTVGQKIREIFKAQTVVLSSLDYENELVVYEYVYEKGQEFDAPPRSMHAGDSYLLSQDNPIVVNENFSDFMRQHGFAIQAGESPKSYLGLAYRIKGEKRGVISLQDMDREHAFTDSDARLLRTIANSMAAAIENARLFDETNQRNAELAVINSVQEALADELDIQRIYDTVGEKLLEVTSAGAISINVYDLEENTNSYVYGFEDGKRMDDITVPINAMHRYFLSQDRTVMINEGFREFAKQFGARPPQGRFPKSVLAVPLLKKDKQVTVVVLQDLDRENAFSQSDVRLLETLVTSMSVSLENARLFDELQRRNREVSEALEQQTATSDILRALAHSPTNIQPVLDAVVLNAAKLCEANDVQIYSVTEDRLRQIAHFGPLPALEDGGSLPLVKGLVTGRVVLERKTIHIEDAQKLSKKKYPESVKLQQRLGHRTVLATPLIRENRAIGAIVVRRNEVRPFTENQAALLRTFADQAAIAIENVRLFQQLELRNREIFEALEQQKAISEILEAVAGSPEDIDNVLELIAEKAALLSDSEDAVIAFGEEEHLIVRAHYGPIPFFDIGKGVRLDKETVTGRVILEGKAYQAIHNPKEGKSEFPTGDEVAKKFGYAMTFATPLLLKGKSIGAVMVRRVESRLLTEKQIALLQNFAHQAVIAIEKARLFEETMRLLDETTQRNAELAVINSVQQAMAQELDIQGIYDVVGGKIREIFDAQAVLLGYFDHASGMARINYMYEKGQRHYPGPFPFSDFMKHQIRTRETVVINEDLPAVARRYGMVLPAGEEPKSGVWVPLISGEKVIGAISLQNIDRENAFSDSDVRLLETLASGMSVALENARLFDESNLLLEESRKREAELTTINTVGQALASELELDGLIELIGDQVRKIFRADIAYLALLDNEDGLVRFPYIYGEELTPIKLGEGLVSRVIQEGQPILINHDESWRVEEKKIERVGVKAKSYLGVPIFSGKQAIGAISVQSIKAAGRFGESDAHLLSTIAANVGAAIRNARLFLEVERRAGEMETLAQLSVELSQEFDLNELLQAIAARALKSLNGRDAVIRTVEPDGKMPAIVALGDRAQTIGNHVGHVDKGITGHVARSGVAEVVNEPEKDERLDSIPGMEDEDIGPGVYAPLVTKSGVIGVLAVFRARRLDMPFSQSDLNFAIGLARHASSAIENARLFTEIDRQKGYFESVFQYSPAAIVAVDFNGTVISWNPAAESLFGYRAEEAIGQDVDSLVASDPEVEKEARFYTRKFTENLGRVEITGKRTRKDGTLVDVEVKGLPISVDGEMVGFLVIYHDISEIETARRAAEEANQAKSAFLANMSHELRTPLNAIIGFTRIVKRKGQDSLPEKQLENLDKVLVSAEHLLGLINTILDIAKIEAGRMELQLSQFDLAELIDSCLITTQPLVRADSVRLSKSVPKDLPQIHSDREKIRQILLNLLSNATKFTHEGSIKVRVKRQGDRIRVAVEDTGIGIAEQNLRKIFDEFQQADNTTTREYGGTGLGLSISRSLAQLLGGELEVSSKEGEGSIFSFSLPLQLGKTEAKQIHGRGKVAGSGKASDADKRVVLVIDDQVDVFNILQQNLEEAGYQVVGALGGEEGIEKARELMPFAITLDIMMPRKDGWQVLYELKNDPRTKDIPVIILTIVDNKALGFRLGAFDYLVKPLNEKAVLDSLERVAKSNGGRRLKKLLVVDDDPEVIDMVRQTLEGREFNIEAAQNGTEALALTERERPDLILLDLVMPQLDGFQFIEEIQKRPRARDIPIVVLTAKSLSNAELKRLQKSVARIVKKHNLASEKLIEEIEKVAT